MAEADRPEPWLQRTLTDVPAVLRAVLHALELAQIDLSHWCGPLSNDELNARYEGIAPVAFHLRHIARSIDRLLTYAEGQSLNEAQIAKLRSEAAEGAKKEELFAELNDALKSAQLRIRLLERANLNESRAVGRKRLPTTVGGLLVHIADHTQRHVGQAVTTAKFVRALRDTNFGRP